MNLRKVLTLFLTLCLFFSFSGVAFAKNCVGNDDFTEAERNNPRTYLCIPEGEEVPPEYNLPKPEASEIPHSEGMSSEPATDDSVSALAVGDGTNNISFASFISGDILVVGPFYPGHAGEWDGYYYNGSAYSYCVWSANVVPVNGVQKEQPAKYKRYDFAYGLWVPSVTSGARSCARFYCRYQNGEPYVITSTKSDQSRWYCSKLVWASYYYNVGSTHESTDPDLDGTGGTWVSPFDLVIDGQTSVFAYSN